MTDEIPSSSSILEFEPTVTQSDLHTEDDNYSPTRNDETMNENRVPSMDEITQNERERPRTSVIPDFDDSDDDDDNIQVIINNYEPQVSTFHINRLNNRPLIPTNLMPGPKPNAGRGGDIEMQGMIRGQPNYEDDIGNAHKDEEKPWKKPGADITDYFNFGFTEESWAQYCDRQRRLRAENNLARLSMNHVNAIRPPMGHPMFPHPMMMANRPMNMQVVPRPMNIRRPDGRIGVIGTIDQNSRRTMLERSSSMNESSFPTDEPSNEEIVDDFISNPASTNEHVLTHRMPSNYPHHIRAIGANRVPFIAMQPRIPYRPPFAPPYVMAGPQYFPRGPMMAGMHGDRPPQPYLMPQQTWNEPAIVSRPDFLPAPINTDRSSRSATPEEKRTTTTSTDQTEKSSQEDRYKERDDRNHHSHPRHDEHKYDRHSRKRHHRDDRSHSSRRTPTKTHSTRNDSSPVSNNQSESISDSRSSSRRSDHRKSSKRSRRDSSDERSSGHRHERSSHSKKNSGESFPDTKPSINQ